MKIRFTIGFILMSMTLSCSSNDERNRISSAGDLGRKQAGELIENRNDTLKMQYLLLETRSCEQLLREHGHDTAADTFIMAFEEYIRANDDSLARLIL